jgi:hypothetical protein
MTRTSEKRGVGFGPRTPTPGPITFRLRQGGIHPVREDADQHRNSGVGFGPRTPTPGPITFRLRLDWIYPVLEDSDGVGFETIRY